MLKVRVIPTLLWKNLGLVKGVAFDSWRRVGTILPAIRIYNTRDVDELILVDIEASKKNSEIDYETVNDLAQDCFVPFTVGGGVNSLDQVKKLLRSGADKVSLNSYLYQNPNLIEQIANQFGSQCVVVSIDVKRDNDGAYHCFSHAGTKATGLNPIEWARKVARLGAGEILLTSIDRDGSMSGYDLQLISDVVAAVNIPVIASGGAGSYDDMLLAVKAGASAVAAASIFHFTEQTPAAAKEYLALNKIPVRK